MVGYAGAGNYGLRRKILCISFHKHGKAGMLMDFMFDFILLPCRWPEIVYSSGTILCGTPKPSTRIVR